MALLYAALTACCAAGYVGELPDVTQKLRETHSQPPENSELPNNPQVMPANNQTPDINTIILPLAPKNIPANYSNGIIKKVKYNPYQKDMDDVVPIIEKLKNSISNEDSAQQFSAIANNLNLYINYLADKYNKKPEQRYQSYKKIVELNNKAQAFAKYQTAASKNIKFISNYESKGAFSKQAVHEYSTNLLYKINDTLILLKESKY